MIITPLLMLCALFSFSIARFCFIPPLSLPLIFAVAAAERRYAADFIRAAAFSLMLLRLLMRRLCCRRWRAFSHDVLATPYAMIYAAFAMPAARAHAAAAMAALMLRHADAAILMLVVTRRHVTLMPADTPQRHAAASCFLPPPLRAADAAAMMMIRHASAACDDTRSR